MSNKRDPRILYTGDDLKAMNKTELEGVADFYKFEIDSSLSKEDYLHELFRAIIFSPALRNGLPVFKEKSNE